MAVTKISTTFIGVLFGGAMLAASFATPALAGTVIKNATDCQFEGGSMTQVKGSDYCLVAIRPAEYADAAYDGNQLGVVDCPGDKLNDGVFCMFPVTIRPAPAAAKYLKLEGIDGEAKADAFMKLDGIDGEAKDGKKEVVKKIKKMKKNSGK